MGVLVIVYTLTGGNQVGRYLSGRSVGQSRIGLLCNGLIKIPMQYFILFVGVMVFVFHQFTAPPDFFNKAEVEKVLASDRGGAYLELEKEQEGFFLDKRAETLALVESMRSGDGAETALRKARVLALQDSMKAVRGRAVGLMKANDPGMSERDTNYIFLSFVTRYLPAGLLGIILAVIFAAAATAYQAGSPAGLPSRNNGLPRRSRDSVNYISLRHSNGRSGHRTGADAPNRRGWICSLPDFASPWPCCRPPPA